MNETPAIVASSYMATPMNLAAHAALAGEPLAPWAEDAVRRVANDLRVVQKVEAKMARRLVQVFIADPNENVPVDKCMLYKGEPVLTDATDQELYFDINLKEILAKHNEERVKLVDKKVKDRTEFLEPAKVRDLKMVVVTIATF